MSVQRAPTKSEKRSSALDTRLQGRRLLLVRVGWLALIAFTLAIFFASVPVYLTQMETPCGGATCTYGFPTTFQQAGVLTGMGLSPGDYAASTLVLTLALMVVCLVVSTLIVMRISREATWKLDHLTRQGSFTSIVHSTAP